MTVLGLCGQSGAGKTTALEVLLSLGMTVCDCDRISREIMAKDTPCAREVIGVFGESISNDGVIDRKALGRIVFNDPHGLATLTEITHRYIKAEIFRLMEISEKRGDGVFVIDAPLLFESGLDKDCDITLAITADVEKRIERIMARDGIDRDLAEKRLASQLSEDELRRLSDEVIVNDLGIAELKQCVMDFAERRGLIK